MKNVSIIMPVYNTGDILKNTVFSILAQTYSNWELLLIDDGSTDGSGAVCDDFAKSDDRIKVFHKANGGISSARNFGLQKISGEYLVFCDHDDVFLPDLLEKCIATIEEYDADVVVFRYSTIFDNGVIIHSSTVSDSYYFVKNIQDEFCRLYFLGVLETVWSMFYRVDCLQKYGLLFNEDYKFGGEDIDFNIRLSEYGPSYIFIPIVLYNHYIRSSLSTSAKYHLENADLHYLHLVQYNNVINKIKAGMSTEDTKLYLITYYHSARLYLSSISNSRPKFSEFRSRCKYLVSLLLFDDILDNSDIKGKDLVVRFLLRSNLFYFLYVVLLVNNIFNFSNHVSID